jgi:hypothetical protein
MALQIQLQGVLSSRIFLPWRTGFDHLDEATDVWLYRFPHSRQSSLCELVITPLRHDMWQDLWMITMFYRDVPGMLARLSGILHARRINIVSMNSSTIELGEFHQSRVLVDCAKYCSEVDHSHNYRKSHPNCSLSRLKRELTMEFIREIAPPPYPSVTIERCLSFWSLYQACTQAHSFPYPIKLRVNQGSVELPGVEMKKLCAESEGARMLISTDPSAELIRIFPFSPHNGILPVSLSLDNRPGAIASVTKALGDARFNILSAKAWTSEDQQRTSLWLLIRSPRDKEFLFDDPGIEAHVNDIISSSQELSSFNPSVESLVSATNRR